MMYGVAEAGMDCVLKVVEKLFGLPMSAIPGRVTSLMVIDTVPCIIAKPVTLPDRLIEAVPYTIDCEAVRAVSPAVILLTVKVKLCVAFGETPLLEVMVMG